MRIASYPRIVRQAVFFLLIALSDGAKQGYAIMRDVEKNTEGRVTLGSGTLYGAVKRLLKSVLVAETCERPDPALFISASILLSLILG